jgi:tRNA threonylcarbamoyladenosine biosynthesis protein TsaB
MECYTAVFDKNHQKIRVIQSEIIDENSFSEIEETIHFVGDGAAKCKVILNIEKFVYHETIEFPSANEMSIIAYDKYKKNDIVDVAYFEPFYLKDFMLPSAK